MKAIAETNKVPGKEIKIIGVGNDELSQVCTPSLSTFNYSFDLTGKKAAQMLLELIENNQPEVSKMVMGYDNVCRESC
jgi:LacI family sucrose operon transcriptional repressor